jgi:hypothetical protein
LNFKGTPLTIFKKNVMLDLSFDPDHEQNGHSCFNVPCKIVEDYGVHFFEKEEASADGTGIHVAVLLRKTSWKPHQHGED